LVYQCGTFGLPVAKERFTIDEVVNTIHGDALVGVHFIVIIVVVVIIAVCVDLGVFVKYLGDRTLAVQRADTQNGKTTACVGLLSTSAARSRTDLAVSGLCRQLETLASI
jgi:hypothetical protein